MSVNLRGGSTVCSICYSIPNNKPQLRGLQVLFITSFFKIFVLFLLQKVSVYIFVVERGLNLILLSQMVEKGSLERSTFIV